MTAVKQRKPNAATVSQVLREHGFVKSSPYTPYGYKTPGYIAKWGYGSTHVVSVLWTYSSNNRSLASMERDKAELAIEVLRAAGFNANRDGRWDGPRASYWIKVTEWPDAA